MDIKKLKPLEELLDSVRDIEGFPIGKDEDILNLSNAPYYTACPNPYINDFIDAYGKPYDPATDTYERKPFVGDVSEGRNDNTYMMHSYPTKVPPKAIENFILHYTNKGDIILDGFAGSGMTGVASRRNDRFCILNDLSSLASFTSFNANNDVDLSLFKEKTNDILIEAKRETGWMYETKHTVDIESNLFDTSIGIINYIIWSDISKCSYCGDEHILWDFYYNDDNSPKKIYNCPSCSSEIKTNQIQRVFESNTIGITTKKTAKVVPVLINYTFNGKRYEKSPDNFDLDIIDKIHSLEIPYWYPMDFLPTGFNTEQPNKSHGYIYTCDFYTKRNLWILSKVYNLIISEDELRMRNFLLNWFTSGHSRLSRMNRYMKQHNRHVGPLSGTLYISPFQTEISPFYFLDSKKKNFEASDVSKNNVLTSNQSSTNFPNIKNNSIDYIFTDPPFGDNLMYSELNFIVEAWLKIHENNKKEAIINKNHNKDLDDYKLLMMSVFKEYFRVLKPNRWITVEFHNSKASVWNAIQESITKAGFIIAQVSVLDKKKGTTKQLSSAGSVKNDLIINAYKPKEDFKNKFIELAGEGMELDFIKQQLNHLPVEPNIERTEQMLYSKMLAHYLESGYKVKYNATVFYELLEDNFIEIDGYWFDESEVNQYNEWKSKQGNLDKIKNLIGGANVLFISDEKSALTWVYNFLNEPKSYSDIYTAYQQVATSSSDEIPELRELLDNNFFTTDGKYRRPDTRQERQELKKNREKELERAWNKMLEKLKGEKKKIKNLRKEALLFGLQKCYDEENYKDILLVADKLHASVLEENSDISDFIDIALIKSEANKEGTLF